MLIEELEEIVRSKLSDFRFNHSIYVAKRCVELARMYNVDIEKAQKVGIVHDIAKEMTDEEKMQYIKEYKLEVDEIELKNTALLHAKIGADIAKRKFGFSEDMVEAVAYHTTAKENMSMLTKILYVADASGEDRDWEDLEYVRNLSETDLDAAAIYILDLRIKINTEKGLLIHIDSVLARNYLLMQKLC